MQFQLKLSHEKDAIPEKCAQAASSFDRPAASLVNTDHHGPSTVPNPKRPRPCFQVPDLSAHIVISPRSPAFLKERPSTAQEESFWVFVRLMDHEVGSVGFLLLPTQNGFRGLALTGYGVGF